MKWIYISVKKFITFTFIQTVWSTDTTQIIFHFP